MFIGSHIPLWLKKEESENVMLTGWVKNIAAYINAATVCIAPIRFGSGTRIKILEYMACGKPVISTKIGVEGLEVTNTEHLILEDDPNKFASYIVNLTENETLTKELGERARDLVERRYAWKKVVKKLVSLYKTII
jgi:glycosyltransferase involved in cell wall biosynthesis